MDSDNLQFAFIGNNAAVDFINTEIMMHGKLVDLLQENIDLVQWTQAAGFQMTSRLNTGDLLAAKGLRQALKDVCLAWINRRPARRQALAMINQHLANHATHMALQARKNDYVLVPDKGADSFNVLLANLAYEGARLLASPQAARIKRCGNTECVLIFVDTSRGQKRIWCSMDTCGNRAKVAKHYRSHLSQ